MARIKSNASKIAFDYIKEKIDRYSLKPGDTVSDLTISKELNISRTPVREAIQKLIQYNLIEKERTKFVVTNITSKDICELIECREAVECQAVKIIIDNGGLTNNQKKKLEEIERTIEVSLKNKEYHLNFKNDALFHNTIVTYSNNKRLIEIMKSLTIQGERLRWLSIITPNRYNNALKEHREIIEHIENKDESKVSYCISNHLLLSKDNYETITKNICFDQIVLALKNLL